MDLLFPLLSSVFMLIILVGANQASLEARVYWRTVLPHTPIPSSIEQLLQPDVYDKTPDTSVNVGRTRLDVSTGEGTSVDVGRTRLDVSTGEGTSVDVGRTRLDVNTGEGTSVDVGRTRLDVNTGEGTSVDVGRTRLDVNTGKGTSVNVGPGGVGVNTGNSKPGGTTVGVAKGGVSVNTGKGTSVNVGPGGVGVNTGNSKPGGTTVGVAKGGVSVNTGKGTSVNVGPGGVGVNTGNSKPGGTTVGVAKGGVNVNTGKGTSVNVGPGGVGVNTGKSKPGGTTVGVAKGGVNVNTGKGTSVNVGHGGVGVQTGPTKKPGGTTVNVGKGGVGVNVKPKGKPVVVHVGSPFNYNYAASDTQLRDDPAVALFFLQQDLHRGKKFTLQLADTTSVTTAAFIPRPMAESVPFSTAELPSILSRFSIPAGSDEAAATEKTLSECEAAPAAGETKWCATSLESMVDFATKSLGTRDVVAAATEGGGAAPGERRQYTVGAVRKVAAAGKGVVACHPEAYAYAVFLCHATTASEVYEVEMTAAEGGETTAKAVAVCHTDTAGWNPNHVAFRVLKVKPGTVPVCHFLPQDHVVWAGKA